MPYVPASAGMAVCATNSIVIWAIANRADPKRGVRERVFIVSPNYASTRLAKNKNATIGLARRLGIMACRLD
jgi:hypothetical protein